MSQHIYKNIQQLSSLLREKEALTELNIIDNKGFLIYSTTKNGEHNKAFQLFGLCEYFFGENKTETIIGIQTDKSITMIKSQSNKQNSNIVAIKQNLVKKQEEANQ